ncbi:MAG TPA: hypothetical protein EYQ60_02880, partial [Myxococcales bacterium]|nr:hypothetical protein [Myxococcales bacterium]
MTPEAPSNWPPTTLRVAACAPLAISTRPTARTNFRITSPFPKRTHFKVEDSSWSKARDKSLTNARSDFSTRVNNLTLKAERRKTCLSKGWPEVPQWVLCSERGTALDPANVSRVWGRLRRRAEAHAVRPLRLHDARHTWASHAVAAGKNIRWISDQIGHADPAFTLRTYAHLMPEEETDLSFADFGIDAAEKRLAVGARKRPYTAPVSDANFLDSANPLMCIARD